SGEGASMTILVTDRRARVLALLLIVAVALPVETVAQLSASPGAPPAAVFKPEELEQVAAPIALYPDPLVAQILMASTYPLEVVQAARFAKDNASLKGDALNAALKNQSWDDSVKSLVSFPQVLTMMSEKLDWTQKLGDAFLADQKGLLDGIQRLRAKAQASGNLKSTPEQTVTVESAPTQTVTVQQAPAQIITIQPTNPQVVYAPTYDPAVAYGPWPYPAYPPYPPYYPPGYVAGTALLSFGIGMAVGGALWGDCDWNNGHADVNVNNYNNYTNNVNNSQRARERAQQQPSGGRGGRGEWKHSPEHRGGVQYRDKGTAERFGRQVNPQQVQQREQFRGRAEQGRQELGQSPQAGQLGQGGGRGDGFGGGPQAGQLGQGGGRGQFGQDAGRGGSAFEGLGQGGRETRAFSDRGQASRGSFERAGGGARSGGGISAGGGSRGGGGGGGGRGGGGGGGRGGGGGGRR
ncbi:MAG: DUF3300 domain-containing protein, partial [Candidatus Rokuibacteriota bacterium]